MRAILMPASKLKLQPEFDDARHTAAGESGNPAEGAVADVPVGITEIRMVQDVEGFKTKLKALGLGYRKVLQDSHIEIQKSRSVHNV